MLNKNIVKIIIKTALLEDCGIGDITCTFLAKQDGVLCGLGIAKQIFAMIDGSVNFISEYKDGDTLKEGTIFAKISGNAQSILSAERVALPFMQRMSGIATYSRTITNEINNYYTKILDTRKTMPGLRILDKYAVRIGGGYNHRYNLADGVLIIDNHISASGSITNAVNNDREIIPPTLRIEVKVKNNDEVNEALEITTETILLDIMSIANMREAVNLMDGCTLVEASGNMEKKSLPDVAKTDVDFISLDELTHSAPALDISIKF